MRINAIALQAAAIAVALLSAGAARAESTPVGVWIDHTGRGAVEISECGGRLCGHVAWVKDAKDAKGCGEQIIGDVRPVGANTWDNGWIYDPDRDERFDVEIKPVGDDKLRVVGYAGTKWLSETMTWKRAPADLQKCAKPGTAATAPAAPAPAAAKAEAPAATTKSATAAAVDAKEPAAKTAAVEEDEAGADETAATDDADDSDKPKKGKRARALIAKVAEALDNSDFGSRANGTCRMQVPYVDMVVTFPCKD